MTLHSIVVNDSGTQIAYTDSGVPSQSPYITIIAIHGMWFCAPIFKRAQNAALKRGVRFIAMNRRSYPGTTPCSEEEVNVFVNGTKEQKDAWHRDRGHELGMFIHRLIEKENIPPISVDDKTGGIILLGWSSGAGDANDTIAYADTLPSNVRSHLAQYVRSLIIHDAIRVLLGGMPEASHYTPLVDNKIPPEDRQDKFAHWISCYFQHGDLSTKDLEVLSWVEPSTIKPASINGLTAEEKDAMVCRPGYELPYMRGSREQFAYAYRKVFFDNSVKTLFPHFKATFLTGDLSPACAISSYWMVENDAKEAGKPVNLKIAPGSNHFLHLDEPEKALQIYLECA